VPGSARFNKLLVVDWDTRSLRIVHALLTKRGPKIDRLLSVAIPAAVDRDDPTQMGQHLRRALDQEGIATRHAVVDVPRDQVVLNTLQLPLAAPEELPGMVAIQIAKELPFAATEAVIDFAVDPAATSGSRADVLVAALRREALARYVATFEAAGLRLHRVGLRPYAHKVAVCDRLKHGVMPRVMFIDVRPTLTEIDILKDGVLAFSRAASVHIPLTIGDQPHLSLVQEAPVPLRPPGEPETPSSADSPSHEGIDRVIHSLVVEVTRSIEAYRASDPGGAIDHVLIGGDVGVEERLAEALARRLNVTTELYNPASSFGWDPDEGASASAFAATLGLVLSHGEDPGRHFDFLHPKKAVSQTRARLRKAPMVAGVAALFLIASVVVLAGSTAPKRAALTRIQAQIDELADDVRDNTRFVELVEEIRAFDENQYVWVDVLYDALAVLPPHEEFVVDHIAMSLSDPQLVLKTRAKQRDLPGEVLKRLEDLDFDGRSRHRFKVVMGPQTEKARELYPYAQDLRISIIDSRKPPRPQPGEEN